MARGLKPQTISSDSALGSAVIERSLRFDANSNTRLVRTIGSTSNRRTYTYSWWLKRSYESAEQYVWYVGASSGTPYLDARFEANSHELQIQDYTPSRPIRFITNRKFRDCTSWMHFVFAVDTTQGTASNRAKLYINGVQETSFSTETYPDQNYDSSANVSGHIQVWGTNQASTSNDLEGYLAEAHFVDGQQLTPSSFGFTDPVTNIWMPKRYEGTHGTNGFHLDFSDNSSASALGIDKSINGNDFTVNNFGTHDALKDSPLNNQFCTWNTISTINLPELREGNLKQMGTNNTACNGTIGVTSGKWYWEQYCLTDIDSNATITIAGVTKYQTENDGDEEPRVAYTTGRSYYRGINNSGVYAYKNYNSTTNNEINSGGTYWGGAVIGFRLDMDAGTLKYYTNNTLVHTDSSIPTDGTRIFPMNSNTNSGTSRYNSTVMNFGQDSSFAGNKTAQGNTDENGIGDFYYAVPSGFRALCTKNLPKPDTIITKPQRHFETILYTPFGGAGSVTGLEFKPDLIWVKSRGQTYSHYWFDSVRGTGQKGMSCNKQDAEGYDTTQIGSFDEGGFTIPNTSGINDTGSGTNGVVAWCWKGGGSSSTYNIDGTGHTTASAAGLDGGTIDPTGASINTVAGFSIISYTGNGTAGATIAHGLGKKPAWIIIKRRDAGDNWMHNHHEMHDSSPEDYYFELNENTGRVDATTMLNDTAPTSTLVTISSDNSVNGNTATYIMYCWAEIPGYSKFGSYTGQLAGSGSGNGNFVHLGFKPAFLIVKKTESEFMLLTDSKRGTINPIDERLFPGHNYAESDEVVVDFLSNGFKARNGGGASIISNDGVLYVYMAFADEPGITPFDTFANSR